MQKRQNTFIELKQKKFIALTLTIFAVLLPLPVTDSASATADNIDKAPEAKGAFPNPKKIKDIGDIKTEIVKGPKKVSKGSAKAKGSGKADSFKNKNGNVPEYLVKDIDDAAKEAGIDPSVLASQLDKESHFNPKAVSSVGAQGIAQFMPATWKTYGNGGDAFNPHDAIAAQGRYLKALSARLSKISKDTKISKDKLILAAYNAGEGAVEKYYGIPPYPETQGYVAKILADTVTFL